jgi:autotransporter translocation and assembly factor TamB
VIWLRRLSSLSATLIKILIGLVAAILILAGLALAVVETGWAKGLIRDLIVRQANNYLTATLSIGRFEGSLLRGIQIGDLNVARGNETLIHVDEIALSYNLRELFQRGVVIERVRLTRPVVVIARVPGGGWDIASLVKRDAHQGERTGPARPIQVQSIEITDGHVTLRDPLTFGAAHVPTDFASLNALFSFAYYPVHWTFAFERVAFAGHAPELSVNPLSGRFGHGDHGWFFEKFAVRTAQSSFTLDGTVDNVATPTVLDLRVAADRLAFQEWSGVLNGLQNIAVTTTLDVSLKGPVNTLATNLRLAGNGGTVSGRVTLDTTVPGWHAAGALDVGRIDLARWLNHAERASDITGRVTFDLALELGRRFPRGVYAFSGPHAMYMRYAADNLRAHGQLTANDVLIARADASAYGATVAVKAGSIGLDAPFPYRFSGSIASIDLRDLPAAIPVPHVESRLTFDYDVTGRFTDPVIAGHARFAESQFLGATMGAGTVGSIDTAQQPLHYAGDGEIDHVNLHRFGEGLDVTWLRAPKYAGTLSGHFHVDGRGSGAALSLTGAGHLSRADVFGGTLSDADVSIDIADRTLQATYDGSLSKVDPAIAFEDERTHALLTGTGQVNLTVRGLFDRTLTIADYDVHGSLRLDHSTVRDVAFDTAHVDAALADSRLTITRLDAAGPAVTGTASGTVALSDDGASDLQYDLTHVDLSSLQALTGIAARGALTTKGRLTGPFSALRAVGDATVDELAAADLSALTLSVHYDGTLPSGDAARATVAVNGHATFLSGFGQSLQSADGTIGLDQQRLRFDLQLAHDNARRGSLTGDVQLHLDRHQLDVVALRVALGRAPWQLVTRTPASAVTWSDAAIAIDGPMEFVDGNNDQRITIGGDWRGDGAGALRITARHVFLDTLQTAFERPALYGGALDLDATVRGTRSAPHVDATLTVTNGRVERVNYQKLAGRIGYADKMFDVELRVDQAANVWLTANGTVPLALVDSTLPERPIDLTVTSSTINLGLLDGLTDVVRQVSGDITLNVKAIGTSRDPHVSGTIALDNAAFLVASSGSRYKNGRAAITLTTEKITVESLHVEDSGGHPLDVHGSLGTHELRIGELAIDGTARGFEVLRNELGRVNVNATLELHGRFEEPRLAGDITVTSGSSIHIDEILQHTLNQPYATEATATTTVDAVKALNPWDRLGLDVSLHVPETLRIVGDNVQVSPGAPVGLGNINVRVAGDLYLYKDPADTLSVTGSFDSLNGTFAFQGRRFDIDPSSSINFRGDLNPELYVTVTRLITGVEARVTITGPLQQPELRLSSNPPLDSSDVMSLIVFNTSTNALSSAQQQELLVRAGSLAAGFLAAPLLSSIQNEIGLNIFQIDPLGDNGTGPRVTIGDEIAPGLVAQFSRQFGTDEYDEANIEYALSRILRIRATYSDAQATTGLASFRRVERTGIDLIFFFSF